MDLPDAPTPSLGEAHEIFNGSEAGLVCHTLERGGQDGFITLLNLNVMTRAISPSFVLAYTDQLEAVPTQNAPDVVS